MVGWISEYSTGMIFLCKRESGVCTEKYRDSVHKFESRREVARTAVLCRKQGYWALQFHDPAGMWGECPPSGNKQFSLQEAADPNADFSS